MKFIFILANENPLKFITKNDGKYKINNYDICCASYSK